MRTKRILALALAVLLLAAFVPAAPQTAYAATAECPDGQHSWGEWITRKAATCTESGPAITGARSAARARR